MSSAIISVFARSTDLAGLALIAIPGWIAGASRSIAWLCVGIIRSGRW